MPSKKINNALIFTDLDGTLLDHHSYSFEKALPMLDFIKKHSIPLVIVTSKTKNEVLYLQKLLGIFDPFIVENGAGIYVPQREGIKEIPMGKSYIEVRQAFKRYAQTIAVRGFGDMSDMEVAGYTGLSLSRAADARQRTFTEPFILEEEEKLDTLRRMAGMDGLSIVQGGRFYHLITKGQDKAAAIHVVIREYEAKLGESFHTLALGDSYNDLAMLSSADQAILIPYIDGSYVACNIPGLIKAPFPGPAGWNSTLKEYFNVR